MRRVVGQADPDHDQGGRDRERRSRLAVRLPPRQKPAEDDATAERALAHPEVQRFQELFPDSQVRTVRNLKENEA